MAEQAVVGLDAMATMASLRRMTGDTVRGPLPSRRGSVDAPAPTSSPAGWPVFVLGVHNPDDATPRWVP